MGPSETTRTDPDTNSPRPWVERYQTRASWTSERRVIGKAEFLEKGANPRFVVHLPVAGTTGSPCPLFEEDLYCARGRHGEPDKRTAVGSVRRPDQRSNDARQSTPAVSVIRRLHAHAPVASSRTPADPLARAQCQDEMRIVQKNRIIRRWLRPRSYADDHRQSSCLLHHDPPPSIGLS